MMERRVGRAGSLAKNSLRNGERGSALLIVFVFAAFVAIMLYKEFPVVVFEAQRQKEELLTDRGHEYIRAVQLFYRKNHNFPASIDQLLDTNRVRYLRRKYKDPMTGKDDWRLLHGGPNGIVIDSKVNPLKGLPGMGLAGSNPNAAASAASSSSTSAASNPNADLLNSATAASGTDSASEPAAVMRVPQRPPAVAANSNAGASGEIPDSAALDANPAAPLVPRSDTGQPAIGADPNAEANAAVAPNSNGGAGALNANAANGAPNANPALGAVNANSGTAGTQTTPGQQQANPMQAVGGLLGAGNRVQGAQGAFSNNNAQMLGGMLVGVASKAHGHSIKRVNDQSDYSLWEFYYDMTKDTSMGAGSVQTGLVGGAGNTGQANGTTQGTQTGVQPNGVQPNSPPNSGPNTPPGPDQNGVQPGAMPPEQNAPQDAPLAPR